MFFLVLVFGIFLQEVFFTSISRGHFTIEIFSILIIFISFYKPTVSGLLIAVFLGLLADFNLAILLGPAMITSVMLFMVFSFLSSRLFISSNYVIFLSIFFGTIFFIATQSYIIGIFKDTEINFNLTIIYNSLFSALLAPLIIKFLQKKIF